MELLGSVSYVGMGWAFSTVLVLIAFAINKANVRVEGLGSWIVFIIFAAAGGIAARPLIVVSHAGANFAIPYLAVAFILSIPVMHWLLPALAPDLQIRTFGVSLMFALMVGIGFMGAAIATGTTVGWLPGSALERVEIPTE